MGKVGTKAIRLVNMLCPMGKLFFRRIWREGIKETGEKRMDFSYGFKKGRRREQAIAVQGAVAWRIRSMQKKANKGAKKGLGFVVTLRDVSNAFPSPSHMSMKEMLEERLSEKKGKDYESKT